MESSSTHLSSQHTRGRGSGSMETEGEGLLSEAGIGYIASLSLYSKTLPQENQRVK